jgi:methylthioribose-1-phosphate isomerase
MHVETLAWSGGLPGRLRVLDQTRLPLETVYLELEQLEDLRAAICSLAVRGAPALGVLAGYGVVLGVQGEQSLPAAALLERVRASAARLSSARPTAVNLSWGARRVLMRAEREHARGADGLALVRALLEEARAIHAEDVAACRRMGELGAQLVRDGFTLLTHCNAGALATSGMGSGLAPIYCAHEEKKRLRVFVDETRPLLQGARLTAWELAQAGIEVTLIADGAAARVLSEGRVDAVFVGADRIAANGDVCNKIGTYGVALAAHAHGVPFYVVAPSSTFDLSLASGAAIPIEERAAEELTRGFGARTAPPGVGVYNPAFDVTPARYVSAIVTEAGVIHAPSEQRVRALLGAAAGAGGGLRPV